MTKRLAKLVLAILVACTSLTLVPPQEAVAITCCMGCRAVGSGCVKRCGLNYSCQQACEADYDACVNRCAVLYQETCTP